MPVVLTRHPKSMSSSRSHRSGASAGQVRPPSRSYASQRISAQANDTASTSETTSDPGPPIAGSAEKESTKPRRRPVESIDKPASETNRASPASNPSGASIPASSSEPAVNNFSKQSGSGTESSCTTQSHRKESPSSC